MEQFGDFLDREELRTRRELQARSRFLELDCTRHRVYARASRVSKSCDFGMLFFANSEREKSSTCKRAGEGVFGTLRGRVFKLANAAAACIA
jgi:hypothetical protein